MSYCVRNFQGAYLSMEVIFVQKDIFHATLEFCGYDICLYIYVIIYENN